MLEAFGNKRPRGMVATLALETALAIQNPAYRPTDTNYVRLANFGDGQQLEERFVSWPNLFNQFNFSQLNQMLWKLTLF